MVNFHLSDETTTPLQHTRLQTAQIAQHLGMLPGLAFGYGIGSPNAIHTTGARLRPLALFLRNSKTNQFTSLIDITAVDRLKAHGRFIITYQFLSVRLNQRIHLQLFAEETSTIPSLAAPFVNKQRLFASAS
jgi:hypothetical protein